jgi:hypothetical protein
MGFRMSAGERDWVKRLRADFKDDVLKNPTVGLISGWLLSLLLGIAIWLTSTYGRFAADQHCNCNNPAIIEEPFRIGVIAVLTATALLLGLETIARDLLKGAGASFAPHWLRWVCGFVARWPSMCLSALDFALVRGIAVLAGASRDKQYERYGALAFWIILLGCSASFFDPDALLPVFGWLRPLGIVCATLGVLMVLSIVRRWTWVERDREEFFILRGENRRRIDDAYSRELRDEAFVSLIAIFWLVPAGLRQVDLLTDVFEPVGSIGLWDWVSFFGGELAKALPFVDWSEVFGVANGSPIRIRRTEAFPALGAQIVFGLRAGIDLIWMAALLQAVSVITRRNQQQALRDAGLLPLHDPTDEIEKFASAGADHADWAGYTHAMQDYVRAFPRYDTGRLVALSNGDAISGETPTHSESAARLMAMTVLAAQEPKLARSAFSGILSPDTDAAVCLHALSLLNEMCHANAGAALATGLAHPNQAVRQACALGLGRIRHRPARDALAAMLTEPSLSDALVLECATALARMDDARAMNAAYRIKAMTDPADLAKARYALALQKEAAPAPIPDVISIDRFKIGEAKTGGFGRSEPFSLGKFAVTFDEYEFYCRAVGREVPSDHDWGRGRRPVIDVTWDDAVAYCAWLSALTQDYWRLPWAAEWELACLAGSAAGSGPEVTAARANVDRPYERTAVVDHANYPPNAWGFHQMQGNVWEWCLDPATDQASGKADYTRAIRNGGSFANPPEHANALFSTAGKLRDADYVIGFRVACAQIET